MSDCCSYVHFQCVYDGIIDLVASKPGEYRYSDLLNLVKHNNRAQFDRQFHYAFNHNSVITLDNQRWYSPLYPGTVAFSALASTIRSLKSELQEVKNEKRIRDEKTKQSREKSNQVRKIRRAAERQISKLTKVA